MVLTCTLARHPVRLAALTREGGFRIRTVAGLLA